MIKQIAATIALFAAFAVATPEVSAQGATVRGQTGSFGRSTNTTNNYRFPNSTYTTNQALPRVPQAGLGGVAPIFGPTGRNGLPVTSLDSFVLNAGGSAELIYGDEGTDSPPPYFEFTTAHRIQRGIRQNGLTTGHGSYMPDAWGGDEFVDGPEWSQSAQSGGGNYWALQGASAGNGMRDMGTNQGGVNFGANGSTGPQGQTLNGSATQASQPVVDQYLNDMQNQNGSGF
jgi:hypothetical protein